MAGIGIRIGIGAGIGTGIAIGIGIERMREREQVQAARQLGQKSESVAAQGEWRRPTDSPAPSPRTQSKSWSGSSLSAARSSSLPRVGEPTKSGGAHAQRWLSASEQAPSESSRYARECASSAAARARCQSLHFEPALARWLARLAVLNGNWTEFAARIRRRERLVRWLNVQTDGRRCCCGSRLN